jgi:hypothetical protein
MALAPQRSSRSVGVEARQTADQHLEMGGKFYPPLNNKAYDAVVESGERHTRPPHKKSVCVCVYVCVCMCVLHERMC